MESKAAKDEKPTSPGSAPKIIYLTDEVRAQKITKCPYCGEEVEITAKRCSHCNRMLDLLPDNAEKSQADRPVNFDSLGYIKSALAAKYEVIEEVAKTDTSTVFRAISMQLRREVALKVLLKKAAQDNDFADRFHRRSRAVDKLSQNNIITIFDEGMDNGVHYMAMEFLRGVDLKGKVAANGPLSPEELVSIMMPAISALGHAHSNGILHGNIKCECIFIHEDGRIILFGFGIPHLSKGNQLAFNRTSNFIEYLSPEEAGEKNVDARSDMYSMGVVMYYALTGKFPYSGPSPATTLDAIVNGKYEPISKLRQVPQWLERIVDKCLQKDVSKRVQGCAELLSLLSVKPSTPPSQVDRDEEEISDSEKHVSSEEGKVEVQSIEREFSLPPIVNPFSAGETEVPIQESSVEDEPPVVDLPPEDELLVEKQLSDATMQETSQPSVSKDEVSKAHYETSQEPDNGHAEIKEKGNRKSRGGVLAWVVAIMVVGALGVGITYFVMNGNVGSKESPSSTEVTKKVPQKEKTNLSAPAQVNPNNMAQPGGVNNVQTEPAAGQGQEGGTAAQTSNPSSQNISNGQEQSSTENSPTATKSGSSNAVSTEKDKTGNSTARGRTGSIEGEAGNSPSPAAVALVTVPDLRGTQLSVARSILSLNGLSLGAVSTIPDPENDGMVLRQVPKPGTQLKRGSTVNLILGSK